MEDFEEPGSDTPALFLESLGDAKSLEKSFLDEVGGFIGMARQLHCHSENGVQLLQGELLKQLPLQVPLLNDSCPKGIVVFQP